MKHDLEAIYALWEREMIRIKRSPSRIIGSIMMPLLFMVFLGSGFDTMQLGGLPADLSYIQFLVPGIIGMTMLFSGSFAGMSLLWDREHGFLKEVMVTPSSRLAIVLGRIAGGSTMSLLQAVLVLAASYLLGFRAVSPPGLATGMIFILLIAVTFIGMGMIFASTMHDAQGFGMIMNFVIFPLFFLSGAIYPIEQLPDIIQPLAYLNPLTYGIDGMRAAMIETSTFSASLNLAVLTAFTALFVGIGTAAFRRMEIG